MSSVTWKADAIASNAAPFSSHCWRVVQGRVSPTSAKLTDTLDEQVALDHCIAESERDPAGLPEECRHLEDPLSRPFRMVPYSTNSRFRRAGTRDGVFYASETTETAVAEAAFFRLLFFVESPAAAWPANPIEHTAFAADIATERAIDLIRSPLAADRAHWTHRTDYSACVEFADAARAAGMEAIRYESVRDPQAGANVAVLSCRAIAQDKVLECQTWHLHLDPGGVRAMCETPAAALAFDRNAFAADPRVAALRWDR